MSISINDVARVAGVSKSTVSRVLGGGPVSEEVRGRVEVAIRQTGYRPNLQARRLRSRHTGIIGLIVADIRNPFFTALIRAVEEVAYREGLRVTLCNTDEDPEREALYLQLMHEERISGLIFAPTRTTVGRLERLTLDFPTVLVDRAAASGSIDSVVLDNPAAMGALVEHLVERGYRRIGGLFGSTSTTAAERRDGYLAAMRTHGLEPDYREVEPTAEAAIATADDGSRLRTGDFTCWFVLFESGWRLKWEVVEAGQHVYMCLRVAMGVGGWGSFPGPLPLSLTVSTV